MSGCLNAIPCYKKCCKKSLAYVFLIFSLPVFAEVPPVCDAPEDFAAQIEYVQTLALSTHSAQQMECAANLVYQLAEQVPSELDLQMLALGVSAQTIELLSSIKKADLMGVETALLDRILRHISMANDIAGRAELKYPGNADVKLLHALILALSTSWLDIEESVATTRAAMRMLNNVITVAPQTQGGMAQAVLGRIYFELPPMLGGDISRAISLLQDAYKRNPGNLQVLRHLAEAYDQELEEKLSLEYLSRMLDIQAETGSYQLMADELRFARGLAQRLNASNLVQQFDKKRSALLQAHPELLTRISQAVGGHGGANPLTGQK